MRKVLETPYEGYLDDCDYSRVSGWCYRQDRPDAPLTLVVRSVDASGQPRDRCLHD